MSGRIILSAVLSGWVFAVAGEVPKVRPDHPRLFFNAETWPAVKARAEGEMKEFCAQLLKTCDTYTDEPVCTGTEPPQPRRVKQRDGSYALMPPSSSTGIPPIREFGCQAAACALAWRLTGERRHLDKCVKMLKASIRGYEQAYANGRAVSWYSTTRINALCAYDWIFNDIPDAERRAIIVPLLKHVEAAQDKSLRIHRRNGGPGHMGGFYGVSSLPWYAGLAATGDGLCDELADRLLALGHANAMRMLDYRNDGAGDDGSLGGCCLGYCLGAYPWAHFNFFHTMRSATGRDIAADYPNMALFPNWIWWSWIPAADDPGRPFQFGLGDTYHATGRMETGRLYEHMSQYMFFYRTVDPRAARLAATLRELAPNRTVGGNIPGDQAVKESWPVYPFLLSGMDDVKPYPLAELQAAKPRARHFEKLGQFFMRSGWRPDDVYCSFCAGASLMMHKHKDENSFVIYKNDFLALDTGTRANQADYNLKHYYAQTVAHNAILIHKPGEPLPRHWGIQFKGPGGDENYGGQQSEPTAKVLAFETNGRYSYVASDAAACYGRKCREALRQFVHVQPNVFVVYDRVETDAPYRTEWLLHTQNEPEIAGGLMRADSRTGRLFVQSFLPAGGTLAKVGGDGKEYWANGRNWEVAQDYVDAAEKTCRKDGRGPYFGRWRLEVSPAKPVTSSRFLHVLTATDTSAERPVSAKCVSDARHDGVALALSGGRKLTVLFNRDGKAGGLVSDGGKTSPLADRVHPQAGVVLESPKEE